MLIIHVLFMVLGAWRITEIISQEVIFEGIRQWWITRFAKSRYGNFLSCSRCISVWAGAISAFWCSLGLISTGLLQYAAFLNWPFAISMLFLIFATFNERANYERQRRIVILPDLNRVEWGQYDPKRAADILKQVLVSIDQSMRHESVTAGHNGK